MEEVEYHPDTSDYQLYTRKNIDSDGNTKLREMERFAADGTTLEKIDLGYEYHYDPNGVFLKMSETSGGPVSEVTFEIQK